MTAGRPPACVLIPTHTTRYLDLVLAALSRQTVPPAHIVVSCDTDDPAIGAVIRDAATRFGLTVHWVRRPHMDGERLCQVRNNGVRHLVEALGCRSGRLITLDGDMIAADDLVARHLATCPGRGLVYPYRVNVDEALSRGLTAAGIASGRERLEVSDAERAALSARARRYRRHLWLRRLRLAPLHKPKLLGGHFSVDLETYLALNGFDEHYQGWGFKDDEFARRAARLGVPVRIAVEEIIAWHLYHPTRQAPGAMRDLPTARRFARRDLPVAAERGVVRPLDQPPVEADVFGWGAGQSAGAAQGDVRGG